MCWTDFRYAPPGWIGDLFFARSLDQGESWQGETQLTFLHQDEYSDIFYVGDTIHVAFERHDAPIRDIYYMKSIDNGVTWENEVNLDLYEADSHDPEVGYGNGRTYVFWCDDRANPDTNIYGGLYFSRYPDDDTVGIAEDNNLPHSIGLTAYPNPFNSSVKIAINAVLPGVLRIYDILGREVTAFEYDARVSSITWDATAATGRKLSSGIYFARPNKSSYDAIKLVYLK